MGGKTKGEIEYGRIFEAVIAASRAFGYGAVEFAVYPKIDIFLFSDDSTDRGVPPIPRLHLTPERKHAVLVGGIGAAIDATDDFARYLEPQGWDISGAPRHYREGKDDEKS